MLLPPWLVRNARMARTSSPQLTNDAATKSTPCSMPNSRSSLSCSVMTGRGTLVPGRFSCLHSPSMPEFCTVHWMSVPTTRSTASSIRPSSIRMMVPGSTNLCRPLKVWCTRREVPSTSSSVRKKLSPARSKTGSAPSSLPVRIEGPFVSSMMAQGASSSRRTFFKRSMRALCSAWEPWEKLQRATSMPASTRFFNADSESTAGPRVQMILVRFIIGMMRLSIGGCLLPFQWAKESNR